MPFYSAGDGDLKTAFVTDAWLIEQFVGNTLFTWGNGANGKLGDNTVTSKSNPIQTIAGGINWKQVSTGGRGTFAIKTDNTLWCWGNNSYGEIGDNTVTSRSSPVQTIAFGTNWKSVAGGWNHIAAIKYDGTLWLCGEGSFGRLGDNTTTKRSSPVQTIAFGTNWKSVACSNGTTIAIKTDGTLWAWGYNLVGQVGDNTVTHRSSPIQTIAYGSNWKAVQTCVESSGNCHVSAIKTDGTLWIWGFGTSGQLGNNSAISRSSPVQTIAFGTNWRQVACGYSHTAAIKTDGTLWCWGSNNVGQLGDNSITNRSSPVQTVTFANNWKQVTCGNSSTYAIKNDGTLWSWGYNNNGQLGDNTTTNKSSPVQTFAYGTNWKQVKSGALHTAAVTYADI
jgi:alpha-tubulin suppressor-like RCC1 family protein